MSEAVTVRPYRPADHAQVRWLHDRTPPAGQVATAPQPWPVDLDAIPEHYVAFWVATEPTRWPGAEESEAVVGMVGLERLAPDAALPPGPWGAPGLPRAIPPPSLEVVDGTLRLERMRVAPERQRRGIGRLLTETAVDWAREHGYRAVILDTTVQQEPARALYEAMGFVERGRSTLGPYELCWYRLEL